MCQWPYPWGTGTLPAMVIDRKAVVYGLTDVGAAIERYQATRGASAARGRAP